MKRRLLASLLAIVMMFSVLPVSAFAEDYKDLDTVKNEVCDENDGGKHYIDIVDYESEPDCKNTGLANVRCRLCEEEFVVTVPEDAENHVGDNDGDGKCDGCEETLVEAEVAEFNGKTYPTLQAAVDAAANATVKNGEAVITLLDDTKGPAVSLAHDATKNHIIIDFDGNTYEATTAKGSTGTPTQAFHLEKGNKVTLKNGTLAVADVAFDDIGMLVQNYCDLTLTDMVLDGENVLRNTGAHYILSNNSGTVVINGETSIIANKGDVAFDVCKYADYAIPNVTVDTTGTIEGKVEVTGGNLTIKAGTFTDVTNVKAAVEASIAKNEASYNAKTTYAYHVVDNGDKTVTVEACDVVKEEIPATCTENAKYGWWCAECEHVYETLNTVENSASHVKGDDAVVVEPVHLNGILQNGTVSYKCEECGVDVTETITAAHDYKKTTLPADCVNNERTAMVCTICGNVQAKTSQDVKDGEKSSGATHYYVTKTVAPTCSSYGYTVKTCLICGEEIYSAYKAPVTNNHSWVVSKTLVESTCTADGKAEYTCELCGATKIDEVAAHNYETVVIKEATCGEAGQAVEICMDCGLETKPTSLNATGEHKIVYGEKAATCDSVAVYGWYCEDCGYVHNAKETGDEYAAHTYDEVTVVKAATCIAKGQIKYTCTVCGDTEYEDVAMLEHSNVREYFPADCVEPARFVTYCTVCGKVENTEKIAGSEPTEKNGAHDFGKSVVTKATCSTYQITEKTCKDCGYVQRTYGKTLDADNHVLAAEADEVLIHSTCDTNGYGKFTCTLCGEDELGAAIEKHNFEVTTVEATCGEDGLETKVCADCGEKVETVLKATGKHNYGKAEIVKTDKYNAQVITCSVCGDKQVTWISDDDFENCAKGNHTDVRVVLGKDATCTETGLTEGKVCEDCGETVVAQEEIPAHHDNPEMMEVVPAVEPTCGAIGLTEGTKCTVCGYATVQEIIPATGEHTFGEWVQTPATVTEAGTQTHTCEVCGAEETETLSYGWEQRGEDWVLRNDEGKLHTGWFMDTYYFGEDGIMATYWEKIDGKWYFFNYAGAKWTGILELGEDLYYINEDGVMATGWVEIADGTWYYAQYTDGTLLVDGTYDVTGVKCTFDENGVWVGYAS